MSRKYSDGENKTMRAAQYQYDYFHDLEQLTKSGLIAYLLMLIAGSVFTIIGPEKTVASVLNGPICEKLLVALASIDIVYILIRATSMVHWLGEFHVWLDRMSFRFLPSSNRIVMREITILLRPDERSAFEGRPLGARTTITQSILAYLAEDQSIFESLLRRSIFRSWIWYWISLYGVFVFLVLTVIAVATYLLDPSLQAKAFFFSIGTVAGIHLLFGFGIGANILFVTRRIVREISQLHPTGIAALLRNRMEQNGYHPAQPS